MSSTSLARLGLTAGVLAQFLLSISAAAATRVLIPVVNILDAATSPGSERFYLAAQDGSVLETSTSDGRILRSWPVRSIPAALDVSPDGRWVAVGHPLGTNRLHSIDLIDTADGSTRRTELEALPNESGLSGLRFASDGSLLVLGGVSGTNQTRLRRLSPGTGGVEMLGPAIAACGFAEDPDRTVVAVFGTTYIRYESGVGITATGPTARPIQPTANVVAFEGGYLECGFSTNYLYSSDFRLLRSFTNPGITRGKAAGWLPGPRLVATLQAAGESLRLFDTASWQAVRSIAVTEPGFNPAQLRRLQILEGGRKAAVITRNAVELIGLDREPFRLVSAHKRPGTNQVVVRFSTPFRPGPATNRANLVLAGGSVIQATPHAEEQEMLVLTTAGNPTSVAFQGLVSDLGDALEGPLEVPIRSGPMTPDVDDSEVEGFEETFSDPVGSRWILLSGKESNAVPATYRVRDGKLILTGVSGPTRYLALDGNYDRTNQDILIRLRGTSLDIASAGPAATIGPRPSAGDSFEFGGLECAIPIRLLEGYGGRIRTGGVPTGPTAAWRRVNRAGSSVLPLLADWYWLRLQHRADPDGSPGRIRVKVWNADGSIPEPSQWEEWTYPTDTRGALSGLAGLVAPTVSSGEFLIDYVLIQAAGLPAIRVRTDGLRAPEWAREPSDYWTIPGGAARPLGLATGDTPLSYLWFSGSSLVASNQTGTLLFRPVNGDTGPFHLVASNAYGSITSAPVMARVGYQRVYSSSFASRETLTNWSGTRWIRTQDSGLLVPTGPGPMRLQLPRIAAGQEVTVHARIQVSANTVLDWSIAQTNGRSLFRTRFSTLPPASQVSGEVGFQSFPAALGESLVPAFTDLFAWGEANIQTGFNPSGSPTNGTGQVFFVQRSFIAPEDMDGLQLGPGNDWGLVNFSVSIRNPETPTIRFGKKIVHAEEGADFLDTMVFRDGFAEGLLTVNAVSEPLLGGTDGFQAVTNQLVFGPGVRGIRFRVPLTRPPSPTNATRFRMRLDSPSGFELIDSDTSNLAIGVAEASREEVRLELPDGDIVSEGRGSFLLRVPSSGNTANPPRGIEVRLDPLDAGPDSEPKWVTVVHGNRTGAGRMGAIPDGTAFLEFPDDLTASPNRRWRISLSSASHGLKATGESRIVTVVDDDTEGYQAFLPRNLMAVSPDGGGGFFLLRRISRSRQVPGLESGILHVFGNGRLDPRLAFPPNLDFAVVEGISSLSDGGFLVRQLLFPGPGLTRITANGFPHHAFTQAPGATHPEFQQVQLGLGDDTTLVVARSVGTNHQDELWRVDGSGAVDESLRLGVGAIVGTVRQMMRLSPEDVLLAGDLTSIGGQPVSRLAKVRLSDGRVSQLDAVLASGSPTETYRILEDAEGGALWVEGRTTTTIRFLRLNSDGTIHTGFRMAPRRTDSQGWPSGALPVMGSLRRIYWFEGRQLRATGPDGRDVTPFHSPVFEGPGPQWMLPLPGGSLVLAGSFAAVDGISRPGLARISADGELVPWPGEPPWPGEAGGIRNVTALAGTTATFRATIDGPANESLQWQRDGISVAGATNATLEIREPGSYRLASIGGGVVRFSQSALVRFLDSSEAPRIRLEPSPDGRSRRAVVSAAAGLATRFEVSEDLRTWNPAEPADLDGPALRLDRDDRSRRYFRVVAE